MVNKKVFESDGTVTRHYSDDTEVLETPFPTMTPPPTAVLGRDVTTGLPMWSAVTQSLPAPAPVSDTFGTGNDTNTGNPVPLPTPPDSERICGAAEQMALRLVEIANIVVGALNTVKNSLITLLTNFLKQKLADDLTIVLLDAEGASIFLALTPLALTLVVIIAAAIFASQTYLPLIVKPNPLVIEGDAIFHIIHCQAYCALQESHGDYQTAADDPTGVGTKQRWYNHMLADWSFFQGSTFPGTNGTTRLPWQLAILLAILDHTPDSLWQLEASDGAHLACSFCTDCGCG